MSSLFTSRIRMFAERGSRHILAEGLRGVEREALRICREGVLATTRHAKNLGSPLTHPYITTDYSEALLELITPPERDVRNVLENLDVLHRYVHASIGTELLWNQSMPCPLPPEDVIPIAWYGTSHTAMLKHVYRRGLALRYGKSMQCIAGIHYNFSVSPSLWTLLKEAITGTGFPDELRSAGYISLMRNFRRFSWLLMYLFGASPAMCSNFAGNDVYPFHTMSTDRLYLPNATSLRMSRIGYRANAQASIAEHFNSVEDYIECIAAAVNEPYPPYAEQGAYHNGEWTQINTNRLQLENEYYSAIRPKQVTLPDERPLQAIYRRGIQYVEVRCIDIDPFEPLGISLETTRFLEAFLLYCVLEESPLTSYDEACENAENFSRAVEMGRSPGLTLHRQRKAIPLRDWGLHLMEKIAEIANLLDGCDDKEGYMTAVLAQQRKLNDTELTPSARVLKGLQAKGGSFFRYTLEQSAIHTAYFRARPLPDVTAAHYASLAHLSVNAQAKLEEAQTGEFEQYISRYQSLSLAL
ncbi:glutamate--cysteine ligase [Noviherbaspirillum saxi]|uniref:Glutamate--cysteine ligase n=1 Tax=Noviherbaspirillum saxi TaxID=2320863 RepID=A0A3A3FSZ3_9BURK|nr:glutamate--cysteine ligase [Noviherbaspirillum saxi]RJF99302.1 glutamate--cysteine ligase [Noviherbaspirillum saxi]